MGLDDLGIARIHTGHTSTFLCLMKDHVDGADQRVPEMKRRDVLGKPTEFLKADDHGQELSEERLHVAIDQPAHARSAPLALFVHQPDELGMVRDVADMASDSGADRVDRIRFAPASRVRLRVGILRIERRVIEHGSDFAEDPIHDALPELQLAAEVVPDQTERHVGVAGDLAGRRAVEPPLGEDLERRLENPLLDLARCVLRVTICSHEQDYWTAEWAPLVSTTTSVGLGAWGVYRLQQTDPIEKLTERSARPVSRRWRLLLGLVVFLTIGSLLRNALGIEEWSAEGVRALVADAGVWAPLGFVGLLIFRLVLVIPSIILLSAGGLLFGTLEGSLYGTIGLTCSGLVNFGFVRWAGPEGFRSRIAPRFQGILEIARSRFGAVAIAVISAYPFGPITVAHLGAAVAGMGFATFLVAVALGSFVRAATFSLFGAALIESEQLSWALAALAAALFVPLLIPRSRDWLRQSFGIGSRNELSRDSAEDPDTGRDT